jgi:hypothetical protein
MERRGGGDGEVRRGCVSVLGVCWVALRDLENIVIEM